MKNITNLAQSQSPLSHLLGIPAVGLIVGFHMGNKLALASSQVCQEQKQALFDALAQPSVGMSLAPRLASPLPAWLASEHAPNFGQLPKRLT